MIKLGNPKRIVMASITMGCALGIGYFMQLSAQQSSAADLDDTELADTKGVASASLVTTPAQDASVEPMATPAEETKAEPQSDLASFGVAVDPTKKETFDSAGLDAVESSFAEDLVFEEVSLTSAEPVPPLAAPQPKALPNAPVQLAALNDAPIGDLPKEESTPSLSCEINMTASAAAAAMVRLDLTAPCQGDMQFTLHHNGMMFTALTDADGNWTKQVPALAEQSVFIAAFDNGEGAVADVTVDMLEYYDRFVVQWKGQSGLQLHAMEYGADYGEDGHVWHDAAKEVATAVKGEGGFLLRLGEGVEDTVLMAEVYTFPTQNALREGAVQISVETEVHAGNCGRDIEAQALVKPGAGELNARDLTMAIPECDAVGDFLVLKNLYEDLKIARN